MAKLRIPFGIWLGGGIVLLVVLCALISSFWTPYPLQHINIAQRLAGSSAQHWLGTDDLGRDVLSQLLAGAKSPLLVAIIAVGIGSSLGSLLGLLAAQQGGWVDAVLRKINDVTFAFPALLTAIMLAAAWQPSAITAAIAIGIYNIPIFMRIIRATARPIWKRDFILAAYMAGKPRWRITLEHIAPHVFSVLLVQMSSQLAIAILAEAALSYLGLGTQAPQPSWGRMLADAQTLLSQRPMLAVYPGMCIAITVLGFNAVGDALRDWLDPKTEAR